MSQHMYLQDNFRNFTKDFKTVFKLSWQFVEVYVSDIYVGVFGRIQENYKLQEKFRLLLCNLIAFSTILDILVNFQEWIDIKNKFCELLGMLEIFITSKKVLHELIFQHIQWAFWIIWNVIVYYCKFSSYERCEIFQDSFQKSSSEISK